MAEYLFYSFFTFLSFIFLFELSLVEIKYFLYFDRENQRKKAEISVTTRNINNVKNYEIGVNRITMIKILFLNH